MLSFSHKQIPFPNQKRFYSKWAKIYSYWIPQRISVSLRYLLLWQVNLYSKQVNSFLFWVFSHNENFSCFSLKSSVINVYTVEGIMQVILFTILDFNWTVKKHCVVKILQGIWETFFMKVMVTIIPINLVTNLVLSLFLSFRRNQKQESNFRK